MNTENRPLTTTTWNFITTIIISILIMVIFVITQFSTLSAYISYLYGNVNPEQFEKLITELQYNGTAISISTLATLVICSSMIILAVKLKPGANLKAYLGLQMINKPTMRYWLAIIICLIITSDFLTTLLQRPIVPEEMLSIYLSAEPKWLIWLALIIAAPIFEELLFRGFLITGLAYSFVGPIGAIILSAAAWAMIHVQYDYYGIATIFVTGIILGIARLKTGSVLLTISMHAVINLIAVIEMSISTSNQAL